VTARGERTADMEVLVRKGFLAALEKRATQRTPRTDAVQAVNSDAGPRQGRNRVPG